MIELYLESRGWSGTGRSRWFLLTRILQFALCGLQSVGALHTEDGWLQNENKSNPGVWNIILSSTGSFALFTRWQCLLVLQFTICRCQVIKCPSDAHRLQSVQNSAARLVMATGSREHLPPPHTPTTLLCSQGASLVTYGAKGSVQDVVVDTQSPLFKESNLSVWETKAHWDILSNQKWFQNDVGYYISLALQIWWLFFFCSCPRLQNALPWDLRTTSDVLGLHFNE